MQIYINMSSLKIIISSAKDALSSITPESLTSEHLNGSTKTLESVDVSKAIDTYWRQLPPKPEDEAEVQVWRKEMHHRGLEINKDLHELNDQLSRLKSLHSTLNLHALEPVIQAAQGIVRPLYQLTAQLSD